MIYLNHIRITPLRDYMILIEKIWKNLELFKDVFTPQVNLG